jgi:cytochrome c-type biogenesis protein CcmH
MSVSRALLTFILVIALALPAVAVDPGEMLPDPVQESRAREISRGLRCVVCQNESIDESNADLAKDLRRLVRERIAAGDTDPEVIDYVVSRYGTFVLLKPPFEASTYALWLGPFVVLVVAFGVVVLYFRRRGAAGSGKPAATLAAPLSAEEEARIARLLGEDGER